MPFNPQNLLDRARSAGRNLQDYAEQTANNIAANIPTSSNIVTNAINSAVGALPSEAQGAINFVQSVLRGANVGIPDILSGLNRGPIENALSKFASYDYVFTFGPLTKFELANPDLTYRRNGPSIIVLRTGGTGSSQVRHQYDKDLGITTEYFIDNVEIGCLIAPNPATKQTNATNISFEVLEPYSMGMFLQTLQLSAMQAGHPNYLQAPFLLTVEFVGWDDQGNYVTVPNSKRMFPLNLSNTTFNVSESGSVYQVTAIPYNEVALADHVQQAKTDLELQGETLLEMLQTGPNSLATQLNSRELELENSNNKAVGDQYVILFPKLRSSIDESLTGESEDESGATTQTAGGLRDLTEQQKKEIFEAFTGIEDGQLPADFDAEINKIFGLVVRRSAIGETIREFAENEANANAIGLSKIAKSYLDSGREIFGRPAFVVDENNPNVYRRGSITISKDAKKVQFAKGTKIQDIIEELILLSEYGRDFISEEPDMNGMKNWFRIETQVYIVGDSDAVNQTGQPAKVFVYRVVPYKVQASRISGPTEVPPGYRNLQTQVLKEYNYIYTGKNDDIISFDIQLNAAFQTALTADFGQSHADQTNAGRDRLAADNQAPTLGQQEGRTDVTSQAGQASTVQSVDSSSGNIGGGAESHPETMVARSLNDAIVNSDVDLVSAEIEIWGDPYYIADSGMGNYNASEIPNAININIDGAMDYQNSEVDILVNFRTPLDIGKDGFMEFPSLGTKPVGAFSGLYQVTQVTNKFVGGKFTQELTTLRRRNQESDTGGAQPLENASAIIERGIEGALSPLIDQAVGAVVDGIDAAAGSIGGLNGIAAQGSAISNAVSDVTGAINGLNGELNRAQAQINNLTRGVIPQGINDAARQLGENASSIFGDDPGGA